MMSEKKEIIKHTFTLEEVQIMVVRFLQAKSGKQTEIPADAIIRARRGTASVIVERLEISYQTTKKEGDTDHG